MAELGAIAAIVQVAEAGLRLSTTLFTFSETVARADKAVTAISKDVSLTSVVLRELADNLEKDIDSQEHSTAALNSAVAVVNECSEVFQETENLLVRKFPTLSSRSNIKAYRVRAALERFKWPYLQPKVRLVQSNLERLKSSLLVILHVISLARLVQVQPSLVDERYTTMIKDLIKTNENHVRRYENLKRDNTDTSATDTHGIAAQKPKLITSIQREVSVPVTKSNQDHDHETKLDNLDHFVALFDRLQQEATIPSYKIGSRSRSRIKKHISDARTREATYLDLFHGETVMKDTWNTLNQKMSSVTPSIDDHSTQKTDLSDFTIHQSPTFTPHHDPSTSQVPNPSHSEHGSQSLSVSAPPPQTQAQQSTRLPAPADTRARHSLYAENVTEPGPTTATSQQSNRPSTLTADVPSRINGAGLKRRSTYSLPMPHNRRGRRFPHWLRRKFRLQFPWPKKPRYEPVYRYAHRKATVTEAGLYSPSQPPDTSSVVFAGHSTADRKLDELLRLWTPVAIPSIA